MKIICLKNQLKEKSLIAERITNKSQTLPILNAILLATEKNHLKIISTNLEVGFETIIPAKIEKEGKVAIPAKIFSSFLNTLTEDDKISLEEKNQNLFLSTKKTSTIIKGYPPDDFPVIPSVKNKFSFVLPASDFLLGLKSVFHAVALSDIKPEIASIFVEYKKNEPLKFAATDSFRLTEKKIANIEPDFNFSFLLPYRSAGEIMKIFNDGDYDMEITVDKNQILLSADQLKFVTKLTEGVFPDYDQVIPRAFATKIIADKGLLVDTIKTASVFSGKLNGVFFETKNDLCEIKTSHSDFGEYRSEVPIELKGENVSISFNYNYFLSGLQNIFSEKVFLGMNGSNKPAVLRGLDDSSYLCLIMPMKN